MAETILLSCDSASWFSEVSCSVCPVSFLLVRSRFDLSLSEIWFARKCGVKFDSSLICEVGLSADYTPRFYDALIRVDYRYLASLGKLPSGAKVI
jgi:hypothetical protein